MRRLLSAAILLLALAGGIYLLSQESTTPASAAATPRAPKNFFGIVPQTALTQRDFEYMKAGGIETVRVPIIWSAVQPTRRGGYEWGPLDGEMEMAAKQGLQILPFMVATPSWLTKKYTTLPIHNAAQRRAWTQFLEASVRRYGPGGEFWHEHSPAVIQAEKEKQSRGPDYELPGAKLTPIPKPDPIRTWQIWNEANFFYFAYPVNPFEYARLLKLSTPAIKRANRSAKVILTGLFGRPTKSGKKGMPAAQFLEDLYKVKGIKSDFDGVALHPYAVDSEELEELVEELHGVTVANHDRVPLYITEMGWGSQNDFNVDAFEHGIRGQVEELDNAYAYLLQNRRKLDLKSVYWFSWKDLPESCAFCDSVGLFKSGAAFRAKPAWRAFVHITHGRVRP